ncbi:MAG: hypothetical protein H8E55_72625 [Pelagibacterales bacterium]|nr:hypothetical protein [Pelagibacterales bacterium]
MIVINVLLDLMLFLYSHIKSSKNENNTINSNVANQIIFEKCTSLIGEKLIWENLKNLGIEKGISVTTTKTK